MGEEQASLAINFHRLMDQLDSLPGGRPDVQIGVVSSNVGTLGNDITACEGEGDDGLLQSAPRVPTCAPPTDPFIYDHVASDGTRITNYTGALGDTFACIAQLGTNGCGYEQHLEAMQRALDGRNTGFLREDAYLAVVFIADEDDCSAYDPILFDPAAEATVGPTTSFRCIEWGVQCDGAPLPRAPGEYESCEPREDSPYVTAVGDYITFLRSLKSSSAAIIPTAIVGDPSPFVVEIHPEGGYPTLAASCETPAGVAFPAIRFRALLEGFPRSAFTSICNEDLSSALALIGGTVRAALENPGEPPPPEVSHGCSIAAHSATAPLPLLLLLALAILRLRRR
jgi:uncharacterized protein (TIGR03382 family)